MTGVDAFVASLDYAKQRLLAFESRSPLLANQKAYGKVTTLRRIASRDHVPSKWTAIEHNKRVYWLNVCREHDMCQRLVAAAAAAVV